MERERQAVGADSPYVVLWDGIACRGNDISLKGLRY